MPDNPDFQSVALIVPDTRRRRSLAAAISGGSRHAIIREFADEPMSGDSSAFARLGCNVAIVDMDHDIDQAVRVIENICLRNPSTTVMACSAKSDLPLARRAMQAGARDFLAEPVFAETVKAAFDRISSRRTFQEKAPGKLLVFIPSKRGVGVTSIASNFAISLARESGARVAIVDMDLQMGDLALGLGLTTSCSVVDALRNPARLDRDFLSSLLMHHTSGVDVLGSPEDYSFGTPPDRAASEKVFEVLRQEFDYVVVDAGPCNSELQESLLEMADKLYLVTELSFPAVRNAHRMMSYLSAKNVFRNLEVVLNRFDAPQGEIGEEHLRKAIGRAADWKIPHGHAAAIHARNNGVPMAMENSPVSKALGRIAKAACGKPQTPEKSGRIFSFLQPKLRMRQAQV
jgi:pilus assembly protein CpaE